MTSIELPPDFKGTFSLNLQLFKFAGYNIYDNPNDSFVKKYGRLIVFSIMFTTLTVLTTVYIVSQLSKTSLLSLADSIPVAALFIQGEFKLMYLLLGPIDFCSKKKSNDL